jgi:hypothetical protein
MHAPAAPGVYGITNSKNWLFIAEADDIRAALLSQLAASSPLRSMNPTGFVFELCKASARTARQERLVEEYGPVCNRR